MKLVPQISTALERLGITGWAIIGEESYRNIVWKDNIVLATEQEINAEIERIKIDAAIEKTNREALAYLAGTDWYVTRFLETGVIVPSDITTLRQSARDSIVIT